MRNRTLSLLATLAVVGAVLVAPTAQAKPPAPISATEDMGPAPKGMPAASGRTPLSLTPCGAPTTYCYSYAAAQQNLSSGDQARGASLTGTVDQCYLSSGIQGDAHCLFELAARDVTGQQIVEVGWNSDVFTNPNGQMHLFVGAWVNNAFQGYNGGGGWVDAAGCNPCAGDSINAAVGTSKALKIEHNDGSSRWDVSYNGSVIGYYPDATWSGGYTRTRLVQVFGELASANLESCSDIGNGDLATSSVGASVTSYALIGSTASAGLGTGVVTNSAAWAVNLPSGTSMRYGGPGYNSAGGANGTAGSADRCAPATAAVCASTFCANAEICPDGSSTGCNTSLSWAAAAFPATCILINGGAGVEFNQAHNSSTTGKEWLVFRTSACSGSSMLMDSNGTGTWNLVMPAGWNGTAVHAYKRVA
jgi:hypothetical protein